MKTDIIFAFHSKFFNFARAFTVLLGRSGPECCPDLGVLAPSVISRSSSFCRTVSLGSGARYSWFFFAGFERVRIHLYGYFVLSFHFGVFQPRLRRFLGIRFHFIDMDGKWFRLDGPLDGYINR